MRYFVIAIFIIAAMLSESTTLGGVLVDGVGAVATMYIIIFAICATAALAIFAVTSFVIAADDTETTKFKAGAVSVFAFLVSVAGLLVGIGLIVQIILLNFLQNSIDANTVLVWQDIEILTYVLAFVSVWFVPEVKIKTKSLR